MTATNNKKLKRKRIWRSIVTTLAAIVVFFTTYAMIIPAITWEKTLICPLEEHVHSDNCYNSAGDLVCGKDEHTHTDACFDAPKAVEKLYICGKAEHTHTDDCYFSDGILKCTLQEHTHTSTCIPLMKLLSGALFDPMSAPPSPGFATHEDYVPTLKKQIDYLGDSGSTDLEDLYRLYLSLDLPPDPIDLLLVIDQSGSMSQDMMGNERMAELEEPIVIERTIPFGSFEWDGDEGAYLYEDEDEGYVYYLDLDSYEEPWIDIYWPEFDVWSDYGEYDIDTGDVYIEMYYGLNPEFSGSSRQEALFEFLNGKNSDHSDGFISMFRNVNEDNHLAVLTFSGDCSMSAQRYIMDWDSTAVSIDDPPYPEGPTNYSAALDIASEVLALEDDCTNRKIMVFLSDGVPTVAYSDGQMQHSYANGNVIGSGNNYVRLSLSDEVKQYIEAAYNETSSGDPESIITRSFLQGILSAEGYFKDDCGHAYNHQKFFSTADVFQSDSTYGYYNYTDYGYPQMVDLSFVSIPVPGINGTWGPFTTENASEFLSWYNGSWNVWSDAQKDAWITANVTATGGEYDIFYLTENSYLGFRQACPDVEVYTIGYSASDFNTMLSGRSGDEVLRYMAGDTESDASGRYFNCVDAEELKELLSLVLSTSNISIIDPLTEYVDLSANPKLEITMTLGEDDEAVDYILYGYDETLGRYDFTDDGEYYLDTEATGFDEDGTLYVVFKPEHRFFEHVYCEASFEVEVNQYARDVFKATGYDVTGDDDTDYGDNDTSSLKPGFYSNSEAIAKWKHGDDDQGNFPNPVVQVRSMTVYLRKLDSSSNIWAALAGAEFDLYREYSTQVSGCITYTDEDGDHYLVKVNTEPIVSVKCGSSDESYVPLEHLYPATYWLFETKAPNGYMLPKEPVWFEIADHLHITAGWNCDYDPDGDTIDIWNDPVYELPETGGSGTHIIYVIGALLMFGALTIGCILWRKREGRGEM